MPAANRIKLILVLMEQKLQCSGGKQAINKYKNRSKIKKKDTRKTKQKQLQDERDPETPVIS